MPPRAAPAMVTSFLEPGSGGIASVSLIPESPCGCIASVSLIPQGGYLMGFLRQPWFDRYLLPTCLRPGQAGLEGGLLLLDLPGPRPG